MNMAERIRERRKEMDFTQEELALACLPKEAGV